MSAARVLSLLGKDLRLGPRSPIFLWAVVMPVIMTLLIQLVFGSLFTQQPRLALVDAGGSQMSAELASLDSLTLVVLEDASELRRRVMAHEVDGGLVLAAGFDEAVRAGERPLLEFYLSGESLAFQRMILAVTTLDLVRGVEGQTAPVEVELRQLGAGEALPLSERLVPLLVLFALLVAGVFVTSFSLVEERENRTLTALLASPMTLLEVLVAKGLLGLMLALAMTVVTLALNGALGTSPVALLLALLVGAVMSVEIGLIYGSLSRDTKSLYTLVKSLNIFLLAPVVFYLFPDWPQWIAQLFPTYWFLEPIFAVTIRGATLTQVAGELLVAGLICLALLPLLYLLARRAQASPA